MRDPVIVLYPGTFDPITLGHEDIVLGCASPAWIPHFADPSFNSTSARNVATGVGSRSYYSRGSLDSSNSGQFLAKKTKNRRSWKQNVPQ